MHSHSTVNRRTFLKQTSIVAGAATVNAWAAPAQRSVSANSTIHIGVIGTGDRASALMREILALQKTENVAITAVCDVWKINREAAVLRVQQAAGIAPRQCSRFSELLAIGDVDAVVIATPDFSHGTILTAALDAGKDVYIEKPMTVDVESANKAFDLARAKGRVVQAGTQRRSEGRFIGAARLIASGAIGPINRVSAAMNVNQARWQRAFHDCRESDVDWDAFTLGRLQRPFDARLLRCWQLFRETSNGLPGLWMTHYADAVHMLTGATYPSRVVSLGGNYVWKDGREHADTFHTVLEYPDGFLFDWSMGLGNSSGVHFTLHGTKGTLDAERWTCSNDGAPGVKADALSRVAIPNEHVIGHMQNWLQCVRSRKRPNADIQFGHQHAVATIMAASALATGRCQRWDAATRQIVAG